MTENPENSSNHHSKINLDKCLHQAKIRIQPHIYETPILKSDFINSILQCNLYIKAECLQRTGSFKIRGALNKLLSSVEHSIPHHLVTWSSGNHGAALAEVARMLEIPATVVVPPWIPDAKVNNIVSRGANVIFASPNDDISIFGEGVARQLEALVIPAYDDISIIEGQATVTTEVLCQFAFHNDGARPDIILYPCGGGSLVAGATLAVGEHSNTTLVAVEPANAADTKLSLAENKVCEDPRACATICDALRNPRPGSLTFEIFKCSVRDVILADDNSVKNAMRMLFEHFKLVTEPGGAIAMAAVLANPKRFRGKSVVAVISGGNVSPDIFSDAIQEGNMLPKPHLTTKKNRSSASGGGDQYESAPELT